MNLVPCSTRQYYFCVVVEQEVDIEDATYIYSNYETRCPRAVDIEDATDIIARVRLIMALCRLIEPSSARSPLCYPYLCVCEMFAFSAPT
ncbi:unnamed protein product [Amoebophrya sp. A25]|nr:unnamed protein product [Amoebophrya sp. A25]|eukprot:GSA25T00009570001.1